MANDQLQRLPFHPGQFLFHYEELLFELYKLVHFCLLQLSDDVLRVLLSFLWKPYQVLHRDSIPELC